MKSPQTTTIAIVAIAAGAFRALYAVLAEGTLPGTEDIVLVLSGVGFLFARDNNRTDRESGADAAEATRELKRAVKATQATPPAEHGPRH